MRRSLLAPLVLLLQLLDEPAAVAGFFEDKLRAFADSEIEFQRGTSRLPLPPLAFLDLQRYRQADVRRPRGGAPLSVDQTTLSQGALLPFLVGERDAIVVGQWASWSRFTPRRSSLDDFDVVSVAAPVGWLRQASPSWQAAAFVMPMGHWADAAEAEWTWETMGGVFARRIQSERLWWVVGAFADVGPGEDLYIPYLGASWSIGERWTLSAVLPWPAILWAPRPDVLLRLGASPSGSSWELRADDSEVSVDLSTVDLGLSAERRLTGMLWVKLEAGIGGVRALNFTASEWRRPATERSSEPYLSLGLTLRPAPP